MLGADSALFQRIQQTLVRECIIATHIICYSFIHKELSYVYVSSVLLAPLCFDAYGLLFFATWEIFLSVKIMSVNWQLSLMIKGPMIDAKSFSFSI